MIDDIILVLVIDYVILLWVIDAGTLIVTL